MPRAMERAPRRLEPSSRCDGEVGRYIGTQTACEELGEDQVNQRKHKVEGTLIVRRIFEAPIDMLWAACTRPEHLSHWWVGGWDHVVHFAETDVRVGGQHRVGFGPAGAQPYIEVGEYTEVIPLK